VSGPKRCRCGHCDHLVSPERRLGWSEACYRRWLRAGKPKGGPPPADPRRARRARSQGAPDGGDHECAGRVRYPSPAAAKTALLALRGIGWPADDPSRCRICGGYHLQPRPVPAAPEGRNRAA
jgi:hypothetical protein